MHFEEPAPIPFAADFRVGDWLVEPSLDRLSRNGAVLRLRPQLTNLLVLLARHAGRTVSRDEILATVWEGQHIAESGMTRCIAELRQALGDDAHEPKVIQTIPKRGYRLVAPVAFLGEQPPASTGAASPRAEQAPALPWESREAAGARRPPLRRFPALGRSSRSALLVAMALALAWGVIAWTPAPVVSERDRVLLADVLNTTGEAAFDHALRLALATQFAQAPFLRILPSDDMRATLTRMGRAADQPVTGALALEVCRREGATVLLAGSIARIGFHYALGVEAITCSNGESIAGELLEVDGKDRVLAAVGTAAGRLRRKLGESRASLRRYAVPIVEATTPSLEALEALSLGDVGRDHARLGEALTFYRRATELDPQFAVAWARRGAAARNLEPALGAEGAGTRDEATLAFTRAYELRERVSEPERFYILGHYYRFVEGDIDKTIETYKLWRQTYPGSVVPPTNLASIYANMLGQYDSALSEAREAVRLAPYSSIARKGLVVSYLGTNRLAQAREVLRDAAGRGAADLLLHELAFELAFLDGDSAAMTAEARWAAADPSASVVLTQDRALASASNGRLREARALWSEAASLAASLGTPARRAEVRCAEAEAEALLGNASAARAAAAAALAADRHAGTLLFAATALALSGNPARAVKLIAEAGESGRAPGICSKFVWHPVALALVQAGSGQLDRAREALRPAARFESGRDFRLAPLALRASLDLSAGRSREAAAAFTQVLRLSAVAPTSPWVAFARLGLARALRDAGDRAGSLAAYEAVLGSLKGADADAPLLIAARRERGAVAGR